MKLLIILLVFLIGASIALLIGLGFYLAPQDELQRADATIAVSGGDTLSRTLEAVRLYQDGWAPVLIFSGAAKDRKGPSNAEAMRTIAIGQGLPPDVVSIDELSETTKQNASEVSNIVAALSLNKVILVTSPYHQRRAFLEFQHRMGTDVTIINHPAPDHTWSKRNWWRSPRGWYLTLSELPKTLLTLSLNR